MPWGCPGHCKVARSELRPRLAMAMVKTAAKAAVAANALKEKRASG